MSRCAPCSPDTFQMSCVGMHHIRTKAAHILWAHLRCQTKSLAMLQLKEAMGVELRISS